MQVHEVGGSRPSLLLISLKILAEFKIICWSPAYIGFASTGNRFISLPEILSTGGKGQSCSES